MCLAIFHVNFKHFAAFGRTFLTFPAGAALLNIISWKAYHFWSNKVKFSDTKTLRNVSKFDGFEATASPAGAALLNIISRKKTSLLGEKNMRNLSKFDGFEATVSPAGAALLNIISWKKHHFWSNPRPAWGPNTPHHHSQHTETEARRRSKAHIRKCQPMAYLMMVVRSSRQRLQ